METKPAMQSKELWTGTINIINILIVLVQALQANPDTNIMIGQGILSLALVILQVAFRYFTTSTKIKGIIKSTDKIDIIHGKEKFRGTKDV